ncbi:MAG: DUF5666 domain-containing protein [Anaerolineaceae bacterium]
MKKKMLWVAILVIASMMVSTLSVAAAPLSDKGGNPPGKDSTSQKTKVPQEKGKTDKADKTKNKPMHFKGTVAEAALDHLTLTLADGSTVTVLITAETQLKLHGADGMTVDQITVGSKAVVTAKAAEDGTYTAVKIMTIPGKPVHFHRVGTVTAYTEGVSITILANDGMEYTFQLTPDAKILPKDRVDKLVVGAKVTIISRRDTANGPLTAQGVVVHPDALADGEDGEDVEETETPEITETPEPTETEEPIETETPTETPTETETPVVTETIVP